MTWRLLLVYVLSLLAGLIICYFRNETLVNDPSGETVAYAVPAAIASALVAAFALFGITRIRLAPVYRMLRGDVSQQKLVAQRLFRWPYELLAGMCGAGLLYSLVYHLAGELSPTAGFGAQTADWPLLIGTVAGEQSLSLSVAILMFATVRHLLRPIILVLQPVPEQFPSKASIATPLLITYAGTFIAAMMSLFQLVVLAAESGETADPYALARTAALYFAGGLLLFAGVTLQFKRELRSLIRRIREVVGGGKERTGSRMPVISQDEAGQLAIAFNLLQQRFDREYESFERELKLAYNVQQKLLPPGDLTIASYRIAARCQPSRGVGGDFFDVVPLGPQRFAVMIGDVSGNGVPAALIMSALLLLFRAEIRRCGSPGETLERLNRQLCEAMGEEGAVSIGVGVIDMSSDTVLYASAGHLSPYIVTNQGEAAPVECSSLPLGFDADAEYAETEFALVPGDRVVLYTDGLIEAEDTKGRMYSFDGLETELRTWNREGQLPDLVDEWLSRMDAAYRLGKDDRTVLVLELSAHIRKQAVNENGMSVSDLPGLLPDRFLTREWSLRSRFGEERRVMLELGALIEEAWPESELREDVQSVVAEAIVNAIEHGNKLQENARVTVVAQVGTRLTVCKIYDEGGGYFPHVSRDEAEMASKRECDDPRGWGLVIIDTLSDYWATGFDERGFYTELYFLRKTGTDLGL